MVCVLCSKGDKHILVSTMNHAGLDALNAFVIYNAFLNYISLLSAGDHLSRSLMWQGVVLLLQSTLCAVCKADDLKAKAPDPGTVVPFQRDHKYAQGSDSVIWGTGAEPCALAESTHAMHMLSGISDSILPWASTAADVLLLCRQASAGAKAQHLC